MQVDNESTVEDSEDEFFPEDDQEDRQSVDNEEEDEEVNGAWVKMYRGGDEFVEYRDSEQKCKPEEYILD